MALRTQILSLLLGAIIAIASAVVIAAWINTSQYTDEQISRSLDNATRTYQQLLRSRGEQLINSAELLTSDFGFKQAVATRDGATIDSALFNHGDRVKADLMFLTNLGGQLVASTHSSLPVDKPFPHRDLIAAAAKQGGALSFVRVGEDLYQIVVVTVVAPVPIGFAGVGFRLNQSVADELESLTNVEVSFQIFGETEQQIISTLEGADVNLAMTAAPALSSDFAFPFAAAQPYITKTIPLDGAEADLGQAYLSVEIGPYLEEYRILRNEVGLIALLMILIAAVAANAFTRSITNPLSHVVGIAQRLSAGDFEFEHKKLGGAEEISVLHGAVVQMGDDIKDREQRLQFQAEHDKLTSVLNRATISSRLEEDIDEHQQRLVCCLNILGFRAINDSLGSQVGDGCLTQMAERLWMGTDSTELVGRFGADEFIVVSPLDNATPEEVIERILAYVSGPYMLDGLEINLDYSVGYCTYPEDGSTADQLIRRANIAIDKGRNEQALVRRYRAGEDEEYGYRLQLIRDLDEALTKNDDQLFMNYQPKMNLRTGKADKLEALIRWIHPENGFVSPELFVALAEQSALIEKLTDWVVARVIEDRVSWQKADFPGLDSLQVAINISAHDLEREELLANTLSKLKFEGLSVDKLCFEMTERDMMNDAEKALVVMNKYRDAGFDLSVDDYGIGQSSLSKLKQMPVNEIKIDKLFITHLDTSSDDQTIVSSTIKLGHDFGLRVIAEGVESLRATELLAEMGCDYVQGYHLAKPMASADVPEWVNVFEERKYREFSRVLAPPA